MSVKGKAWSGPDKEPASKFAPRNCRLQELFKLGGYSLSAHAPSPFNFTSAASRSEKCPFATIRSKSSPPCAYSITSSNSRDVSKTESSKAETRIVRFRHYHRPKLSLKCKRLRICMIFGCFGKPQSTRSSSRSR